jgi:hypothetical protein
MIFRVSETRAFDPSSFRKSKQFIKQVFRNDLKVRRFKS